MSVAYILKYHGAEIELRPVAGTVVAIKPPEVRQEYPFATLALTAALAAGLDMSQVTWEPVESAVLTA